MTEHPMLIAMAKAMGMEAYRKDADAERIVEQCWQDWLPEARAALTALLDLTPDAVEAGLYQGRRNMPLADQWPAIINHILKGGE